MAMATILSARTTTGAGSSFAPADGVKTIQATLTGTGSISATVAIEVSNDGTNWISDTDSTLVLSGTNSVGAGVVLNVNWGFIRANVTAISGTGASVTVTMGV